MSYVDDSVNGVESDIFGGGGGSFPWGGAITAGIGAVSSLFGHQSSADKGLKTAIPQLLQYGQKNQAAGEREVAAGHAALMPVLAYLTKVASGNPADVLQATQPERARVMDQYDAARRSIAATTPRGGGTSSVINQSRFDEASTLSNLTATARREGVGELGNISKTLEALGISQEQIASGDIGAVVQAYLEQSKEQHQSSGGFGKALGSLIGTVLPFFL